MTVTVKDVIAALLKVQDQDAEVVLMLDGRDPDYEAGVSLDLDFDEVEGLLYLYPQEPEYEDVEELDADTEVRGSSDLWEADDEE